MIEVKGDGLTSAVINKVNTVVILKKQANCLEIICDFTIQTARDY